MCNVHLGLRRKRHKTYCSHESLSWLLYIFQLKSFAHFSTTFRRKQLNNFFVVLQVFFSSLYLFLSAYVIRTVWKRQKFFIRSKFLIEVLKHVQNNRDNEMRARARRV